MSPKAIGRKLGSSLCCARQFSYKEKLILTSFVSTIVMVAGILTAYLLRSKGAWRFLSASEAQKRAISMYVSFIAVPLIPVLYFAIQVMRTKPQSMSAPAAAIPKKEKEAEVQPKLGSQLFSKYSGLTAAEKRKMEQFAQTRFKDAPPAKGEEDCRLMEQIYRYSVEGDAKKAHELLVIAFKAGLDPNAPYYRSKSDTLFSMLLSDVGDDYINKELFCAFVQHPQFVLQDDVISAVLFSDKKNKLEMLAILLARPDFQLSERIATEFVVNFNNKRRAIAQQEEILASLKKCRPEILGELRRQALKYKKNELLKLLLVKA